MQTLEFYLGNGIHRDREDIAALERVLRETGETIAATFDEPRKDWPYEVRRENTERGEGFSQSTSAMMINAIDLLRESAAQGPSRPAYPFDTGKDLGKALASARGTAFGKLTAEVQETKNRAATDKRIVAENTPVVTDSGTYGPNDPLTLSFLAEILPPNISQQEDWLRNYAQKTAGDLLALDPAKDIHHFFSFKGKEAPRSKPLTNAFVPLRIVRAARVLGIDVAQSAAYQRYFDSTLHDQLSYSSIPDSRFDPAELVFCLEGLLSISPQSVDAPVFERVLEVLEAAQKTSAHWRPTKPFLRNERGLVLFPVSVEAANSLLWSCQKLDEDERFHRYSERHIELFRRFWGWLAARRVRLGDKVSGWHSENIADPDSIQLWDTAQVVGFLLGYRRSLYNHIARTTLHLARFDVRKPKRADQSWSSGTRELQHQKKTVATAEADDKAALRDSFEPVTSLRGYFKTYEKIEQAFLIDWLKGEQSNYSMLLYGPPGTGKTSVAENLADALGFRMITITVSDFLAEGSGGVEARAKMIFEVLQAQANCVILFDEIDELVLDRSSARHGQQDTVFKFMTPGMLTKLNNLRGAKRSIFIMATNFAYRIDPAIRRTGRIDENYLLLPPDAQARRRMLKAFLKNASAEVALQPGKISEADWKSLEGASFFLGYKDIEAAVWRLLRKADGEQTVAALADEMIKLGRTTTLRFYKQAFAEAGDDEALMAEFLPLADIAGRENGAVAATHKALDIETAAAEISGHEKKPVFSGPQDLKMKAAEFVQKQNAEKIKQ